MNATIKYISICAISRTRPLICAIASAMTAFVATNVKAEELSTNAHHRKNEPGDCYLTDKPNVAVCISKYTLRPCTVVNDTTAAHVESNRAKNVRGIAVLYGSAFDIGNVSKTEYYNINTPNGVDWYPGACQ